MPQLWNRTLPSLRPEEKWKFAAWAPDVVVVNLMTNDYVRARFLPSHAVRVSGEIMHIAAPPRLQRCQNALFLQAPPPPESALLREAWLGEWQCS